MARKPWNIAASVRARLQNLAREQQADFQRVLTRYALERLLFRLSVSPHKNLFVLKGAMLYVAWLADPFRTTRDLDLPAFADRETTSLLEIFRNICSQPVADDGSIAKTYMLNQAAVIGPRKLFGSMRTSAAPDARIFEGFPEVRPVAVISHPGPTTHR